jgi:hypothetical protein
MEGVPMGRCKMILSEFLMVLKPEFLPKVKQIDVLSTICAFSMLLMLLNALF